MPGIENDLFLETKLFPQRNFYPPSLVNDIERFPQKGVAGQPTNSTDLMVSGLLALPVRQSVEREHKRQAAISAQREKVPTKSKDVQVRSRKSKATRA